MKGKKADQDSRSAVASGSAYLLAEKIASEILTVYGSSIVECTRAQLMLKQENGQERNMGGRNKTSIIKVIERHLKGMGL